MDYPPWLPKPEHSRRGMVLALARCIYENWYQPELHAEKGKILIFDNRCSSGFQRVASILHQAGFTRYIDHTGRRSVFNVGPDGFDALADAAEELPLSDGEIEDAVLGMADGNHGATFEVEDLAEIILSSRS